MKVKAKESREVKETRQAPADKTRSLGIFSRKKWERKHRKLFQPRTERSLPLRLEGRRTGLSSWITRGFGAG